MSEFICLINQGNGSFEKADCRRRFIWASTIAWETLEFIPLYSDEMVRGESLRIRVTQ